MRFWCLRCSHNFQTNQNGCVWKYRTTKSTVFIAIFCYWDASSGLSPHLHSSSLYPPWYPHAAWYWVHDHQTQVRKGDIPMIPPWQPYDIPVTCHVWGWISTMLWLQRTTLRTSVDIAASGADQCFSLRASGCLITWGHSAGRCSSSAVNYCDS